jgi:GT2 family glycosyltransferase
MLDALDDSQIMHIPYVLYHWRTLPQSTSSDLSAKPYALEASRGAVREHLERQGLSATVNANPDLPIFNRVTPRISGPAKVSIVIPTRDQAEVLATCVSSILQRTTYPEYEILIVNNGSVEQATRDYFDSLTDPRIMILDYPEAFNYSAINNFAVLHSTGDFICMLNNDIEVLTKDWLEQMMCFAQLPQIGAVGAKLFYPNGKIQHSGVVLGLGGLSGVAGHVHRYFPKDAHGYMGRAMVAQEYSAVTGACLLVSKEKYLEVGGLTEELAVGFNDVDFCLKLLSAGYKNVFTPHSQLTHFESLSRGADITKEQIWRASEESLYMIAQWKPLLENDPAYNRHLTAEFDDFSFAWPPRKSNGVY